MDTLPESQNGTRVDAVAKNLSCITPCKSKGSMKLLDKCIIPMAEIRVGQHNHVINDRHHECAAATKRTPVKCMMRLMLLTSCGSWSRTDGQVQRHFLFPGSRKLLVAHSIQHLAIGGAKECRSIVKVTLFP